MALATGRNPPMLSTVYGPVGQGAFLQGPVDSTPSSPPVVPLKLTRPSLCKVA